MPCTCESCTLLSHIIKWFCVAGVFALVVAIFVLVFKFLFSE